MKIEDGIKKQIENVAFFLGLVERSYMSSKEMKLLFIRRIVIAGLVGGIAGVVCKEVGAFQTYNEIHAFAGGALASSLIQGYRNRHLLTKKAFYES